MDRTLGTVLTSLASFAALLAVASAVSADGVLPSGGFNTSEPAAPNATHSAGTPLTLNGTSAEAQLTGPGGETSAGEALPWNTSTPFFKAAVSSDEADRAKDANSPYTGSVVAGSIPVPPPAEPTPMYSQPAAAAPHGNPAVEAVNQAAAGQAPSDILQGRARAWGCLRNRRRRMRLCGEGAADFRVGNNDRGGVTAHATARGQVEATAPGVTATASGQASATAATAVTPGTPGGAAGAVHGAAAAQASGEVQLTTREGTVEAAGRAAAAAEGTITTQQPVGPEGTTSAQPQIVAQGSAQAGAEGMVTVRDPQGNSVTQQGAAAVSAAGQVVVTPGVAGQDGRVAAVGGVTGTAVVGPAVVVPAVEGGGYSVGTAIPSEGGVAGAVAPVPVIVAPAAEGSGYPVGATVPSQGGVEALGPAGGASVVPAGESSGYPVGAVSASQGGAAGAVAPGTAALVPAGEGSGYPVGAVSASQGGAAGAVAPGTAALVPEGQGSGYPVGGVSASQGGAAALVAPQSGALVLEGEGGGSNGPAIASQVGAAGAVAPETAVLAPAEEGGGHSAAAAAGTATIREPAVVGPAAHGVVNTLGGHPSYVVAPAAGEGAAGLSTAGAPHQQGQQDASYPAAVGAQGFENIPASLNPQASSSLSTGAPIPAVANSGSGVYGQPMAADLQAAQTVGVRQQGTDVESVPGYPAAGRRLARRLRGV